MKELGIVVLNYNKKDYVLKCIGSLLNSSINNFQIYVIDNASSDGSVEAVTEQYGNVVEVIANKKGVGSSGGFNQGMLLAKNNGHKYIMLCDNDIELDKFAVENLYNYLENNSAVGLVGPIVMKMDYPDIIQSYGSFVETDKLFMYIGSEQYYKDYYNRWYSTKELECDFNPACTIMFRTSIIDEIELMWKGYFTYWDDIEFCYNVRRAGYKIFTIKDAKIWHKGSGNIPSKNLSRIYYQWRNRLYLFSRILPDNKIESFAKIFLKDLFTSIYGAKYKKKDNFIKTLLLGYKDFLEGINGEILEDRILTSDKYQVFLPEVIERKNNLLIVFNGDYNSLKANIIRIRKINKNVKLTVCISKCHQEYDAIKKNLMTYYEFDTKKCNWFSVTEIYNPLGYELVFEMCKHVALMKDNILPKVYIDSYSNCISNQTDFEYWNEYDNKCNEFISEQLLVLVPKIKELRKIWDII